MSDASSHEDAMLFGVATELSDREIYLVGRITVLWGMLEFEIFEQTAETYAEHEAIPKAMNNLQPSKVLELWHERVVERAEESRKEVLERQYHEILHYGHYRHDIVHGMWDWSRQSPDKISVMRFRNKEFRTTQFSAADLVALSQQISRINFAVRYPGGLEDVAEARSNASGYISRGFWAALTSHPVAEELLPPLSKVRKSVPKRAAAKK